MKKIAILGSTGSIGTQALDIIGSNRGKFKISALTCGKRTERLSAQIEEFRPALAVTEREEDAQILEKRHPYTEFDFGSSGLRRAATCDCDIVLNALMGMMGMVPTYYAICAGRDIALANKETLVAGGRVIMEAARKNNVAILPVDSEHSAIFQSMEGNRGRKVKRILLTASGGPFRGYKRAQLEKVTLDQALKHPKWEMGHKITIDSATMMNKGLEVIEARWLFDVVPEKIQILVHPQSIVHSMVEYEDTSVIAQLGRPDMRVPISYALNHPERLRNDYKSVDFFGEASELTFEKPDTQVFACIRLAYEALDAGGVFPAVLNGANEVLVDLFLKKQISFISIQETLEKVLNMYRSDGDEDMESILEADKNARDLAFKIIKESN